MPGATNDKDIWDRITSLATILVPAAIALAGHFIAQGLKQAEISNEQRRAEQSHSIAESNLKIAQASLINTMMKSLTSPNPQERKLAVEAVLIALPEQGPVLARTIAKYDKDMTVQDAAKNSLEQRVDSLIHNLFSEDAQTRIAAAQDLIQGWRNDPGVVQSLIAFASEHKDNPNGVYNTLVVLNEFGIRALEAHRKSVIGFVSQVQAAGPKTGAAAAALTRRLEH
jgi:hypothetical protein